MRDGLFIKIKRLDEQVVLGRKNMQKDELIQFHTFLLQLKNHLEDMVDNNDRLEFQSYNKLNITPFQVYKSKREHQLAVFTLSKGIAILLSHNNHPGLEKVSKRLGQISERFMTEKELGEVICE